MDPSYPYLFNSLLVAEGRQPALIAHPGLTLETLGALALWVTHVLGGSGTLRDHVLLDPEAFLGGIQVSLLVLLAAANLFQGWAVRSFTGSTRCAVAAQLVPFCSRSMETTFRVMCEPLGLSIGLVLAGLVCLELREGPQGRSALVAVLSALGIATKVSFAPLVLVPFVALERRRRPAFVTWLAVALALILAPVAPRLLETLAWYARLAGHTGPYGGGRAGLVDPSAFGKSLLALLAAEPIAHAVGLLALLLLVARRGWMTEPGRSARTAGVLWTILGVQCSVEILSARQAPLKLYYLMPAVALSGLSVALMHRLVPDGGRWRTGWTWALCSISISGIVFQARVQSTTLQERRWTWESARAAGEAANRYPHERVVHGPVVPCIHSALQLGNVFSANAFSRDLRRLYPRSVFLDRGIRAFGHPIGFNRMRSLAEPDGSFVVWESASMPLDEADWITNPRTEHLGRPGALGLTRLRAEPLTASSPRETPASPPFSGLIALEEDDLWRAVPGQQDRVAMDPPGRFVLTGSGGPMWLVGEARYEGIEPQTLRFTVETREAFRIEMARGSWHGFVIPLQTVRGLNTLVLDYSSAVDVGPWPQLGSVPGTGVGLSRKRSTGVVFRRLQLCGPGM